MNRETEIPSLELPSDMTSRTFTHVLHELVERARTQAGQPSAANLSDERVERDASPAHLRNRPQRMP